MEMPQVFTSAVISESSPSEEKQRAPPFLDRLEKNITIDPQKIEIMHLADVIVRRVSLEF
jgi:hypothetical protein